MESVCRWGILGTAGIARKNWKAIRLAENASLVAVASRSVASAEKFIHECSSQVPFETTPEAEGTYEDLLARDDIDAVYIPLPTALRYEWVTKAAEAGKHIIGEKPAASNATQVAEMLDACRSNGVQYMDGVMFMHSKRLQLLRATLDDPAQIGKLRRIASQFSFAGDEEFRTSNIRTHSELEPYGCLGDLGWYCTRIFLWIMNGEMPVEVRARTLSTLQGTKSPGTVPGEFSAELTFASGVTASFYNSFVTENQQWFHASGTEGYLRVDDFVLPFHGPMQSFRIGKDTFAVNNCEFHMEHHPVTHSVREYDAGAENAQEVNLFRNFSSLVLRGSVDESWPDWTLKTQRVLDACFESATNDGKPVAL